MSLLGNRDGNLFPAKPMVCTKCKREVERPTKLQIGGSDGGGYVCSCGGRLIDGSNTRSTRNKPAGRKAMA